MLAWIAVSANGAVPDLVYRGTTDFGWYGFTSAVGDLDGDGARDLVLVDRWIDVDGRVQWFAGGPGGPADTPTFQWTRPGGRMNYALNLATGDLDGDGDDELVVSDHDEDLVHVFPGGSPLASEPQLVLVGENAGDWFGYSLATTDTNGDGYADLLVAAPHHQGSGARVYLYLGGPGGLDPVPWRTFDGYSFYMYATHLSAAGDLDADGFGDFAVSAPHDGGDGTGAVYVHLGGPDGPAAEPSQELVGSTPYANFGGGIGVGDVNGDGFDDLSTWEWPLHEPGAFVRLHLGTAGGVEPEPVIRWSDGSAPFGAGLTTYAVSSTDYDGDGFSDLVIGSTRWDGLGAKAYVFRGGPGPLAEAPAVVFEGTVPGDAFGVAVRGLGDLDGDGLGDVLVDAPYDGTLADHGGTVRVFRGECEDEDGDGVCPGDCAPDEPDRFPGATERCNGLDDDCDGAPADDELDRDGDGELACASDCDDDDPGRSTAASERCDGVDDDCDGEVDEGCPGPAPPSARSPSRDETGCGCATPAGAPFALLLLLPAIVATARSRR